MQQNIVQCYIYILYIYATFNSNFPSALNLEKREEIKKKKKPPRS